MTETLNLTTIIEESSGLINSIINKYKSYYEYDDLYQVATIGIIKAYKNFKPEQQVKFSTYAYTYILGEVIKYAYDNRGVKQSNEYRLLGRKIEEARTILTQRLMKEPSSLELASFLNLPLNIVEDIALSNKELESLDRIISDDGKELTLLDTVVGVNNIPSPDEIMLHTAISNLPEPDRSIIALTYYQDYTQEQIASSIGMSQVQISRNLTKSKNKLRKILSTTA
jgi:RNA polymerase sporulation-specific sigma factor